jgi:hypothetical protein
MTLDDLVRQASNKENFTELKHYVEFCEQFLDFIGTPGAIQAEIVSRNETHYRFIQFKNAEFSISRPLNSKLLYTSRVAKANLVKFLKVLDSLKKMDSPANREIVNRSIYTMQQSIGASLDALPAGRSNTARKINGDLFERFIRLVLIRVGVECTAGVVKVPVKVADEEEFMMSYQHDLIIKSGALVKIIGSVKTSSKDRLDKVFVDKFLLAKLTEKDVPHVAIFLNDVQRKGKTAKNYGVSATFLPGHFKGYTIKLNPLDGVYYFDIRPNMLTEPILKNHIRTFDHFLFTELWSLLKREAVVAKVEPKKNVDSSELSEK